MENPASAEMTCEGCHKKDILTTIKDEKGEDKCKHLFCKECCEKYKVECPVCDEDGSMLFMCEVCMRTDKFLPCVIPCGHTLCETCCASQIHKKCPICKEARIDTYAPNYALNRILAEYFKKTILNDAAFKDDIVKAIHARLITLSAKNKSFSINCKLLIIKKVVKRELTKLSKGTIKIKHAIDLGDGKITENIETFKIKFTQNGNKITVRRDDNGQFENRINDILGMLDEGENYSDTEEEDEEG